MITCRRMRRVWAQPALFSAPWYVVPADVKKNARLIVSQIILDTMKELGMSYPTVDKARVTELQAIRKEL
jgi:hypothetical protein